MKEIFKTGIADRAQPSNARPVVKKQRDAVPTIAEWQNEASGILRSLIARDNLRPEQVVDILQRRGVLESDRGLKEKMLNGTYSLAWFLQFIVAMQRHPFSLETDLTLPAPDLELYRTVRETLEAKRKNNSARAKKGIKNRGQEISATNSDQK